MDARGATQKDGLLHFVRHDGLGLGSLHHGGEKACGVVGFEARFAGFEGEWGDGGGAVMGDDAAAGVGGANGFVAVDEVGVPDEGVAGGYD